jgi:hypothetical protein
MPRVNYMLPMQGFRPKTNPLGALGKFGLRGLGQDVTAVEFGTGASTYGSGPSTIVLPGSTDASSGITAPGVYANVQQGSTAFFQAALPWIAAIGFILWVKKK